MALPKAAKWGIGAALVLAVLDLLASLWMPMPAALLGLAFLGVAFGLRRGNPWAGYGGALLVMVLIGSVLAGLSRTAGRQVPWAEAIIGLAFYALPGLLMFLGGRSLAASGSGKHAAAWIGAASLATVSMVVLQPFVIPTGAMEDTLLIGDQFLVVPLRLWTPERGDIVALRYPVDRRQSFIKRIVAVGGDRVRLRDKKLWVNGQEQHGPFVTHKTDYMDLFRDNFPQEPNVRLPRERWEQELKQNTVNGEFVVPAGKLFVLGDNRDMSLDSRYWGLLDPPDVIGKPLLIYFSVEKLEANSPVLLQPDKIRWSRILKLL